MENNWITISGKVLDDLKFSHVCYDEKFYMTKIECYRTSGNIDIIPILVSEKLVSDFFIKDEYIFVNGNIRTRNVDGHLNVVIFAENIDVLNIPITSDRIDENNVKISGHICKKNELRTSPGGRTLLDCTIALNRQYNKSDYVPCIIWGRNANMFNTIPIGTKVNIIGRFQSRVYCKNNKEQTTYEISVQSISEQD